MAIGYTEKKENNIVIDYAYRRAIDTGELKKDTDVEYAVVMFRLSSLLILPPSNLQCKKKINKRNARLLFKIIL